MNLTIIGGIFASLALRFLHRRRAILVAIAGLGLYTFLVGGSPPVVRAAIMVMLLLFARYVGREAYAPVSLAVAAVAMSACNPYILWDTGFQLSFASTAGLMLYTEPLERLSERMLAGVTSIERAAQIVALISESLLVTLAALLTTWPIIMSVFGRFSLVTLLSNALVLPAQPYVMTVGGTAALLGMIIRPLGQVVGWGAWLFLTYTLEIVRLTARIPRASVPIYVEGWMVWAYFSLLIGLTWWLRQPRDRRRELRSQARDRLSARLEPKLLLGASAMLLVLAFVAWRSLPDGRLHVTFLDVGQGDAILVQTPSGRQVLIDGGPRPSLLLAQLGRHMPFWDRKLNMMILTHPDADHITGLVAALERYRVDAVIWRDMDCQDPICQRWRQLLVEEGATVYSGEAGLDIALDQGLRIEVLHPGVELPAVEGYNDNSIVTRLTYGQASLLLTGDITARVERQLLASGQPLRSTVLKAPHHGSCTSTTGSFLEAVDPELVVISVGEDNDFGQPCDEVLQRLGLALHEVEGRLPLYRTDEHGTVELVTDGSRLWVETERADDP